MSSKKDCKKNSIKILYAISFVLILVLSIVIVPAAYIAAVQSNNTKQNTQQIMDTQATQQQTNTYLYQNAQPVLPNKYRVNALYTTPIKDQGSRGTCWDFSTQAVVESAYKANGLKKGFLQANQYVKFSEQAWGKTVINVCTEHPELCLDTNNGQQALNTSTDGYPSWLYYMQQYTNDKLVVDLPSCPYTPDDESQDNICPGYDEFVRDSPIRYEVTDYKQLHTVDDMKQALVKHDYILPLVTELYYEYFYVPCDTDSHLQTTTECTAQETLCPGTLQNTEFTRYCYAQGFITSAESEFYARSNSRTKSVSIGAHAINLVGWNDEYRTQYENQKGALIIKNSWGTILGHSINYLMSNISFRNEQYICPNINSPKQWVPVNYEGEDRYKLRSTTWLDYVQYAKPGHFHIDDSTTYSQALDDCDLVKYTDSTPKVYALYNYVAWTDQTVKVTMMECDYSDIETQQNCRYVDLPPCKLDYLTVVFQPHEQSVLEIENYEECGYYAVPYSFVDYTLQNEGLWFVDDMTIEFTDDSYVTEANKNSSDANKNITAATHTFEEFKFKSHTQWQDDSTLTPRFK